MKKFFEKNDLFKLAGLFVLIAIILSWIVPYGFFDGGKLYAGTGSVTWNLDLSTKTPIGFFDWSRFSLLGLWYFTAFFVFIFMVAGFYKLLGNTVAYQTLIDKLAKKVSGKENIFIVAVAFIIAAFSGISNDTIVVFMLIPFAITVMNKLGVNKITALLSTFGATLVGVFGATYSTKVTGWLVNIQYGVGVSYGYEMIATVVLFAIAFILLSFFAIKANKKGDTVEDIFASSVSTTTKKKNARVNTLPLTIILVLLAVVTILAFIPWDSAFNITIFKEIANNMKSVKLFGANIVTLILGENSFLEFGNADLLNACGYMLMSLLFIKIIYHISMDKIIESYGEGFKTIGKSVVILLVVYSVLVYSVIYPVIPAIVDLILGLGKNIGTLFVSGALTSVFTVDFQYAVSTVGSVFGNFKNLNIAALILQSSYGLVGFIAPTSAILMLGLSTLNIKFSEYVKSIWKFLLALTVLTIIVIAILMYI